MHVAEQYALSCGAQISPPPAPLSFVPIPFEKYICIATGADVKSKKYDYYQEVIDHLTPLLETKGLSIIQIGDQDDKPLRNCTHFLGTSCKQLNYIVAKSSLVISNDSYTAHAAGICNRPLITLFSPLYKDTSKPLWGDPKRQLFIESHRNGEKPSFMGDEKEYKRINLIFPEEIAEGALDLLQIPHDLDQLHTLYMGPYFSSEVIEVIPDTEPDPDQFKGMAINLRLDLHFDPKLMAQWAFNRKLNIVSDQPLERKHLDIIRPHVAQIMMEISTKTTRAEIQALIEGGYNLYLHTSDTESINDLRLKFIDLDINLKEKTTKKDLDKASEICDNTCFKSSKTMASKNKLYSSKASWQSGVEKHENEKIIDCPEFWEETEYFRIYNK